MKYFWIYAIECVKTGQIYVGQTSKPSPFWRWGYHMNSLKNRYSNNELFQRVWDIYPDLTYWRFQALKRVKGKINANHYEVEEIQKIPKEKRLNLENSSPGLTLVQRQQIEELLKIGLKGYVVAERIGVSAATVSNIKKELIFADSELFAAGKIL